jgi:CRISPR-associated DxTHG motif protein
MKLLTFLGTSDYTRVTYTWDGRDHETELFPEALGVWLQPSEMLVLLTAEAQNHQNWNNLQMRLSGQLQLTPKAIPSGKSEGELWRIFETLTECLNEGDDVIFDVTHAFRSLPVLALLAAAYLRTAKSVNLQALLYGAFEARGSDNRVPVFDLTPFLGLLGWVTATDKFVKTGDARELARLLGEAHRLPWQSASQERQNLPYRLQGLGTTLENLSQSLALVRPQEVAEYATALAERLETAAVETARWAQPFTVLLKQVESAYAPFETNTLATQRELVRWYVEGGHVVQAATLAREWLVSWTCCHLGKALLTDRKNVTDAINQASRTRRGKAVEEVSPLLTALNVLPAADVLVSTWDQVQDLRNDVAHCGMRIQPRSASSIMQSAAKLVDQLNRLPLPSEETM